MRLAIALLVALFGIAHADRHATLGVDGGLAMRGEPSATTAAAVGGLLSASLSWEQGAPLWRDDGAIVVRAELAPELAVVQLVDRGAVLGGLRLGIQVAGPTRQGGHARITMLVTPRAGAIERGDGAVVGGDVEIGVYLGRSPWRIGMREGFLVWRDRPALRSNADARDELAAYAALAVTR